MIDEQMEVAGNALVTAGESIQNALDEHESQIEHLTFRMDETIAHAVALQSEVDSIEGDLDDLNALVNEFAHRIQTLENPAPVPNPTPPNLQALIDNTPNGGVVTLPPGTYQGLRLTVPRPMTIHANGVVLDGLGSATHAFFVTGSQVEIIGVAAHNYKTPLQQGTIMFQRSSNSRLMNANVYNSTGACVSLQESSVHVFGCDIHRSEYLGFHGYKADGSIVENCQIHDNESPDSAQGWENGGLKVSTTNDFTIKNCDVYNNNGPGLWADINCRDWFITDNRIYDNAAAGIFYEISSHASITGNVLYGNGLASPNWGEGAAIRLANSHTCIVHFNTVAWNADGIVVTHQNRPEQQSANGNLINDNIVAIRNPTGTQNTFGIAFVWDNGVQSRTWTHQRNRVFHAHPNNPGWAWAGPEGSFPNNLFTRFEPTGQLLTATQMTALLSQAGVPAEA